MTISVPDVRLLFRYERRRTGVGMEAQRADTLLRPRSRQPDPKGDAPEYLTPAAGSRQRNADVAVIHTPRCAAGSQAGQPLVAAPL